MSPMIPSSSEESPVLQPSGGESNVPPATQEVHQELSSAEQRRLQIAQGGGMRREQAPIVYQESGEEITLRGPDGKHIPCKYCTVFPCRGPSWIFEGVLAFKCNACGRKQKLGNTQDVSDKVKAELDGLQVAERNRKKMWREQDAEREEARRHELQSIAVNPNRPQGMMLDPRFVSETFFQ